MQWEGSGLDLVSSQGGRLQDGDAVVGGCGEAEREGDFSFLDGLKDQAGRVGPVLPGKIGSCVLESIKHRRIRSHQHSPCPPTNSDCPPPGSSIGRVLPQQSWAGVFLDRRRAGAGPSHGWVPFVCPLGGLLGRAGLCLCYGAPSKLRACPGQPPAPPLSSQPLLWGTSEGWWGAERAPSPAPRALIAALIVARQSPSPYYYD